MSIDDFDVLPLSYKCRFGMPGGNGCFTDSFVSFTPGHVFYPPF